MRCSVRSFIRRSIILFLVSALRVFVSVHLAPSLSLMKGSTQIALFFFFFPGLTYTNVLMDRGDKDNEGEERGDEEWRREGQYTTHTRTHTNTQMRREILEGGRFCGHEAHLGWERESWRWHASERERRGGEEGYETWREAAQRGTSGENGMIIHSNTSTAYSSNIISARFTH